MGQRLCDIQTFSYANLETQRSLGFMEEPWYHRALGSGSISVTCPPKLNLGFRNLCHFAHSDLRPFGSSDEGLGLDLRGP